MCKWMKLPVGLGVLLFFGLFSGCASQEPILVGLAVELTGRQADVGINVRDAALMAVEEVNALGGVNGRPLELVVRDDQGLPEVARLVDAELVEMGVVAIIGHYTSTQTAAVLDQMNAARVVLLSPSASSAIFSGKDDYFLRLIPDTSFVGETLGQHIMESYDVQRVLGVYDENNRVFSEFFWLAVDAQVRSLGGATEVIVYNSPQTDLQALAGQIKAGNADAIVIVASAVDTAVLAQYLRQISVQVPLFSSPWAQTSQLIEKGGQAVQAMELSAFYDTGISTEPKARFVRAFEERFGRGPSLGASQAYEAVMMLAKALETTGGSRDGVREALLGLRGFPGLLGPITFDAYGDVQRDVYIMRVENGQIVNKKTISPQSP